MIKQPLASLRRKYENFILYYLYNGIDFCFFHGTIFMDVRMNKLKYIRDNWKSLIHILLATKRFGVNNEWWSSFDSIFGIPWYKRTPSQIIWNYKMAKFRATKCYFVSKETAVMLFGKGGL